MESVLNIWKREATKIVSRVGVEPDSLDVTEIDSLAMNLALIEIREAIEENTAVQRSILDHARGISDESASLLTTISGFCEDLKSVSDGLASQRQVSQGLIELVAKLGDRMDRLAKEKQDRPSVLNGPDTAGPG